MGWARAQDKIENSQLECTDWKQRTVTAHPTWLKIPFKIIMCTINQDEGGEGCLSEASPYFPGKAWNPSKNTPALCATPERPRGTTRPLEMHEFNQLRRPTEFNCVNKKKVMHPHWPQGESWQMVWDPIFWHRLGEQREWRLGSPLRPSKLDFNKWATHTGCVISVYTLWFTLWNSHDK